MTRNDICHAVTLFHAHFRMEGVARAGREDPENALHPNFRATLAVSRSAWDSSKRTKPLANRHSIRSLGALKHGGFPTDPPEQKTKKKNKKNKNKKKKKKQKQKQKQKKKKNHKKKRAGCIEGKSHFRQGTVAGRFV